jgi:hypothetical protein
MAKCDEGYICHRCGQDVPSICDSDLYLRYVLGLVDPEVLHTTPERHIRCNPCLAQFIVDPRFDPPVHVDNEMGKQYLDADYVRQREELVTRAYCRLHEIRETPGLSILEFPLSDRRRQLPGDKAEEPRSGQN